MALQRVSRGGGGPSVASVDEIERRIRAERKRTGCRLEDMFKQFDKMSHGRVTVTQFERGFNMGMGTMGVSPSEMQALVSKYSIGDVDGDGQIDVDYKRFTASISSSGAVSGQQTYGLPLSNQETDDMNDVVSKLAQNIAQKGFLAKPCFQAFDRNNSGFVTEARFRRAIAQLPAYLSAPQVNLLIKAFVKTIAGVKQNEVCYRELITRIDPTAAPGGAGKSTNEKVEVIHMSKGKKYDMRTDGPKVEDKVLDDIVRRNIDVKPFLHDFDKLHSGFVSTERFTRALATAGVQTTSPGELALLARRYVEPSKGPDVVDYQAFLSKVVKRQRGGGPASSSGAPVDSDVAMAMAAIQKKVKDRGIFLKDMFKDYDRYNRGHITESSFFRVLGGENLLTLIPSESTKAAIVKKYSSASGVDYVKFTNDLKPKEAVMQQGVRLVRQSNAQIAAALSIDVLMKKIRTHVKKRRINLRRFFQDFDSLHKGHISRQQFSSGAAGAGLSLSAAGCTVIAETYQHPNKLIVDSAMQPYVDWTRFCDDIESAFTIKGLESNPTANVSAMVAAANDNELDPLGRLSAQEEAALRGILQDIEKTVRVRGLNITTTFKDFDRNRSGKIPKSQFERALYGAMGQVSAVSVAKIVKAYGAEDGLVNYRQFLTGLDSSDGQMGNMMMAELEAERAVRHRYVDNSVVDLDAVLRKVVQAVSQKNIKITDFMMDYDKLRKGYVAKPKFGTALSAASIQLSKPEVAALIERFKHFDDMLGEMVDYSEFTTVLTRMQEASGAAQGGAVDFETDPLVAKIRKHVKTHRLDVKAYYVGRDKLKQGHVPKGHFLAGLDYFNCRISQAEQQRLMSMFASRKDSAMVDYGKFSATVDLWDD